jgi:hypothetical protein
MKNLGNLPVLARMRLSKNIKIRIPRKKAQINPYQLYLR